MAFPIDALPPDMRALFEHLHCPVCLELKANTKTVCKQGHLLCGGCITGVMSARLPAKCPTCRQFMIGPVPCQPINALAQALGITVDDPVPAPAPAPVPAPAPAPAQQPVPVARRAAGSTTTGRIKYRVLVLRKLSPTAQHAVLNRGRITKVAVELAFELRSYRRYYGQLYRGPFPVDLVSFGRDGVIGA